MISGVFIPTPKCKHFGDPGGAKTPHSVVNTASIVALMCSFLPTKIHPQLTTFRFGGKPSITTDGSITKNNSIKKAANYQNN